MTSVDETALETLPSDTSLLKKTCIIIPTYNARRYWDRIHASMERQGIEKDQVLIVDSSSSDGTRDLVRRAGYRLKNIPKESFRHGATRQMAADSLPWAEVLVYLTQDALPCGKKSVANLLAAFENPAVGAAYGRQLPREAANPIERHARLFNYPKQSQTRDFEDRHELGIKAAFFSNSFAAYRRTAFEEVGGFPKDTIVSEEVTVAARMLMAGWKLAYRADATVIHSHPLSVRQESSRYFDIGVHHGRESWLLDEFGTADLEGKKFVRSEMRYLWEHQPSLIPVAMFRTLSKWASYKLGRNEAHLPDAIKEALSAQPNLWAEVSEPSQSAQSHIVARTS